jgi:hypothetical protein
VSGKREKEKPSTVADEVSDEVAREPTGPRCDPGPTGDLGPRGEPTAEDHVSVYQKIRNLCAMTKQVTTVEEAVQLVRELDREDTLMPLLDPTKWRELSPNIVRSKKWAEAFLTFRRALEETS